MISCQQLTELVTDYVEGRLSMWDRVRFRLHLALCPACQSYVAQLELTVAALGRLPEAPLSPEVEAELREAFRSWRERPDGASR